MAQRGLDRGALFHLRAQFFGPFLLGPERTAQFELRHDLPGQDLEHEALVRGDALGSWRTVEHANRSDRQAFRAAQERASVEAQALLRRDERISGKSGVVPRVGNDHEIVLEDCVRADGDVERHFARADAGFGLEPLPVLRDQIDDGNGRVEDFRGKPYQIVEFGLGRGVEDRIALQRGNPFCFRPGGRCGNYA
ncbi:hypothetical protein [Sphingobium algorifonticola]|uniref:hypothetical protein n=1 Tax=Sphingobium algorifonticola TaxID=2008318 RepID=UPI001F4942BC|nr:hypothetical protein [Sphingobium algorifonticola]